MIEYVEARTLPSARSNRTSRDGASRPTRADGGGAAGRRSASTSRGRLVARRAAAVSVAPATGPWAGSSHVSGGAVLSGPGSAARSGALGPPRGRRGPSRASVYLLDPDPPQFRESSGALFTAVHPGRRTRPDGDELATGLPGTRRRIPAGVLLRSSRAGPTTPGLVTLVDGVATAEAGFAAAVPAKTAAARERRLLVEASIAVRSTSRTLFEKVHHSDWTSALRDGLRRFRAEAARRGLPAIPPRPVGAGEPAGNSWAAARLEERAVTQENDEHRAALLHAAARWIDESGRDLAPVVREGTSASITFGALAGRRMPHPRRVCVRSSPTALRNLPYCRVARGFCASS